MVFEKIRRARIEAWRLYEPGTVPMLVVLVMFWLYAVVTGLWLASAIGGGLTAWTLRLIYRNDHRWRATDEPE